MEGKRLTESRSSRENTEGRGEGGDDIVNVAWDDVIALWNVLPTPLAPPACFSAPESQVNGGGGDVYLYRLTAGSGKGTGIEAANVNQPCVGSSSLAQTHTQAQTQLSSSFCTQLASK